VYYTLSSIYMAFSLYLPVWHWVLLRLAPTDKLTIVIAGCSSFLKQPQIVYNYSIAKGWLKLVSIIKYQRTR